MEYDLRTGTPYRISCLRQQPSGVDRRCQIWPIRGYTRFWYKSGIPERLPLRKFHRRSLVLSPSLPSFFPALSLALVFARAPLWLSECLEQATSNHEESIGASRQNILRTEERGLLNVWTDFNRNSDSESPDDCDENYSLIPNNIVRAQATLKHTASVITAIRWNTL